MEPGIKSSIDTCGRLIWTMTTNGYKFYTMNLYKWMQKSGLKLCIMCCDKESYTFFRQEGVSCTLWEQAVTSGQMGVSPFGSADFARWNRMKLDLLRYFASNADTLGIQYSLYLDGDIVIQKDPWPLLQQIFSFSGVDMLFQCDCSHHNEHTQELPCYSPCTGVIATWHRSADVKGKLQWLYSFDKTAWEAAERQDQPYIRTRLEAQEAPMAAMLPRTEFGNGTWQQSGKWKTTDWILLHYNYRVGDTKKQAMKGVGHWLFEVFKKRDKFF